MKLTYFQLEPHLTKNLSPIYIVSGEDVMLKQDAQNLLRKAAKKAGFNERTRLIVETGFDDYEFYNLLYATSLMSEKRLLELDCRDNTPNKALGQIIQEYTEKLSSDLLLLINMDKVDSKIAKNAWYQACEKKGTVVTIWPITREQLPQWIASRARKYKLEIKQDAAQLLADSVEGNMIAAANALEKIYLLQEKKVIDCEIVNTILTDESCFSVFDFIEQLISGDSAKTLHILKNLREEGTEPVLILWGIARELRLLADLATQLKQGSSCESLFQQYRIFARRQNAIRNFLNRFSAEKCWQLLQKAADIDKIIKGAAPGNVWDELQLFCLRIENEVQKIQYEVGRIKYKT